MMVNNSKELVKKAVDFTGPCRVPLDIRSDPDESDIVGLEYGSPQFRELEAEDLSEYEDEWGCRWEKINRTGTQLGQVKGHPLADWRDFDAYQFPDPCTKGRFQDVEEKILKYRGRYLLGNLGVSGFCRLSMLRGFENVLTDIYMEPAKFSQLADKVFGFEEEIIRQYGKLKIDGFAFFDDWGTEKALFIRPEKWREIFKPRYSRQFELIHKSGMKVFFHSCGYVWDILGDFVDIGVDVLNLEQPLIFGTDDINGIDRLANTFGGKVCFECPVDQQRTLSQGSEEQIVREVRHLICALGNHNGGFIALADGGGALGVAPEKNIVTMMRAFREYGKTTFKKLNERDVINGRGTNRC